MSETQFDISALYSQIFDHLNTKSPEVHQRISLFKDNEEVIELFRIGVTVSIEIALGNNNRESFLFFIENLNKSLNDNPEIVETVKLTLYFGIRNFIPQSNEANAKTLRELSKQIQELIKSIESSLGLPESNLFIDDEPYKSVIKLITSVDSDFSEKHKDILSSKEFSVFAELYIAWLYSIDKEQKTILFKPAIKALLISVRHFNKYSNAYWFFKMFFYNAKMAIGGAEGYSAREFRNIEDFNKAMLSELEKMEIAKQSNESTKVEPPKQTAARKDDHTHAFKKLDIFLQGEEVPRK